MLRGFRVIPTPLERASAGCFRAGEAEARRAGSRAQQARSRQAERSLRCRGDVRAPGPPGAERTSREEQQGFQARRQRLLPSALAPAPLTGPWLSEGVLSPRDLETTQPLAGTRQAAISALAPQTDWRGWEGCLLGSALGFLRRPGWGHRLPCCSPLSPGGPAQPGSCLEPLWAVGTDPTAAASLQDLPVVQTEHGRAPM